MKTITVGFKSITYAIKIRKNLLKSGVNCQLIKLSSKTGSKGCAYGIKFDFADYYAVTAILKESNIPYTFENQ